MLQRLLRAFSRKNTATRTPNAAPPTPAQKSATANAAAVAAVSAGGQSQTQLLAIIAGDADTRVRDAALARIHAADVLLPLLNDARPAVRDRVYGRFAALAEKADAGALERWLDNRELAVGLACATRSLEFGSRILDKLDAATTLNVATSASLPAMRREAATRLRSEAELSALEHASRADKTINRVARERLDAHRRLSADLGAVAERLTQLDGRAAQLERAQHDHLLAAKIDHLGDTLAAERASFAALHARTGAFSDITVPPTLAAAADQLAARITALQQRTREQQAASAASAAMAAARAEEQAARAEAAATATAVSAAVLPAAEPAVQLQPGEQPADVQQSALTTLRELSERLRPHNGAESEAFDAALATLPAVLAHEEGRWLAACDRLGPPREDAHAMRALVHDLKALLAAATRLSAAQPEIARLDAQVAPLPAALPADAEQWLDAHERDQRQTRSRQQLEALVEHIAWPTGVAPPSLLQPLLAANDRAQALHNLARNEQTRCTAALASILPALEQAIAEGSLAAARARQADARRILRALPVRVARDANASFAALSAQVSEMRAWHDFATEPKRETLCAEIETLAATAAEATDIPALADRIKATRAAWHALGPVVSAAERAQLDRFNEAADRAFAPCRAWFEALAEVRAQHLAERTRICDQLEQFIEANDWSHADWRGAQQILRTARDAFRESGSVDRAAGREIGKRFDALADRLHGLIQAEMDRNLATRRSLIAEAQALVTDEAPIERRISGIKSLQQRWKEVGIVPRRLDQALWKEFRAPCDAVFATRTDQYAAEDKAVAQAIEAANRICEAIEVRLGDEAPIENAHELEQFRTELQALQLPRDEERRVSARLRELEQVWQQRLRNRARDREANRLLGVLVLHDRIAAMEAAADVQVDGEFANREAGGDDALAFAIDARLAAARGTRATDPEKVLGERRRLTVATEILAGLESPADDQQLRLQTQLSRLNESLANRSRQRADIDTLLREWLAAGPAAGDATTQALRARMETAVRAYLD